MKIVVLDGYTLNPGDLSWDALEALGDTTIHEYSAADEVVPNAQGADIIMPNKAVISREVIEQLPDLKYIGVQATGFNVIDLEAASEKNIVVTNIPTYGTPSVGQMVFAHLLNLTQRVAHHAETVKEGRWASCRDFCYWDFPLTELMGLTMGIVGYGRIGQRTGDIALAFGMKVLAHDEYIKPADFPNAEFVSVDEIFKRSDAISLHCPLTPETDKLANATRLALMKPTAFLINTSRGPLVDDQALADALNAGTLAGAGLDVLSAEPPPMDNPLITAKNCFITPHIAWATRSARSRLLNTLVENAKAWIDGKPQNVVN
jgi:glycerate dehydrogenase